MWLHYVHHITTHFPIVMSMVLGGVGLWFARTGSEDLRTFLRWGGWITTVIATTAALTGLASAPDSLPEAAMAELDHHRNLGILCWLVIVLATLSMERGIRREHRGQQTLGALLWMVAVVAAIGTGHWGGSMMHSDRVPWQGTAPILGPKPAPVSQPDVLP